MTDHLSRAIVESAMHIPKDLLVAGAAAIEDFPTWSASSESALLNAVPAVRYRSHAEEISRAWANARDVTGAVVAASMKTAAATASAVRAEHRASLVWTGPSTGIAGMRSTRSVLFTLVANATQSLLLVSFASHDVADLTLSLADATARGVEISVVLETPDDPGGPLGSDSIRSFGRISTTANFYRWPSEAREAFFSTTARLHAKCVIADRSSALITSANLTSAGINDNIELGVLIEAGPLPAKLSRHFDLLKEMGILQMAQARGV